MITRNPTSRTLIVHPMGDMDTLRADHYRRQLRTLVDEGYRFLIFDFQDTPYINSSGLGLLVELYNKTSRLEGSVRVINCTPHVQWVLDQTQLNKILLPAPEADPPAAALNIEPLFSLMSDEILFLAQLQEVTEQILAVDEIPAICNLILKGLIRSLHARRGAFFLLAEDAQHLSLACWQDHQDNPAPPAVSEVMLKPGRLETRILNGEAVIWHELGGQDESEQNLFFRLGYDTFVIAPIRGRRSRYGLVVVEAGPDTAKIINASKPLVRTFANLCGLAMEKTLASQQLARQQQAFAEARELSCGVQQALDEAGRLAALGVVISGLGHLINNKMVPLLGYAQMLAQKKDLSEWVSDKVARIYHAGAEMTQIVDKLVKICHVRDKSVKSADLAALLHSALEILGHQIRQEAITVHVEAEPGLPPVQGNPDLLLQAILAILHRACTSFPGVDRDERWIRITSQMNGESLQITFEDNGCGFEECDKDGWLDPLVPVEGMGHGAIFTYTIPRGIIRKHHGALTLAPQDGTGKRVIIDLPAVKEALLIPTPTALVAE